MGFTTATMMLQGRRLAIEAPAGGVIARAWAAGRWYEAPLLEYIRDLQLPPGSLAVDAGANVGNHTLWFALACGLRVAAFEPLHHHTLTRNVLRNGAASRVTVHPWALGRATGRATHVGKGALRVEPGAPLHVIRLDDCGLQGVTLIKADVEYMEPDVLAGGVATIERDQPIIFAEVHPGREAPLAAVLEPMGYHLVQRFKSKWVATPVHEWRPLS